jgi:hypothetical protein
VTLNEEKLRLRSARSVSLFMLIFSVFVSGVIFFTNEDLDIYDCLLMVFVPVGLTLIAYFVVLYNDPDASD